MTRGLARLVMETGSGDMSVLRSGADRGLMIVEEPLVIRRGLDAGIAVREVYFCPDHLDDADRELLAGLRSQPGADLFALTDPVMAKIAYRDRPQGLLVVAVRPRTALDDLPLPEGVPPLLVMLEAVEKPGNLGAVQRVADGAGADGVIVCGGGVDPWNPNVLRASRGACFSLPTVEAGADEAVGWLRARGIRLVATSPDAGSVHHGVDLTGPVAILLGTEHDGLSGALLNAADVTVGIPMRGAGDSLNVSTSAAILLYEALRQRTVP